MISSRKQQLVITLILACICAPTLAQEPNEAKTELKFEIDNKRLQPWADARTKKLGKGPIKPTHVALLYIRRPSEGLPKRYQGILEILNTSAGKSLSEQQRQFLTASDAVVWWGIEDIQNHDMVPLYAVSEEDARKTVRAYLEVAISKVNSKLKDLLDEQQELEEKIAGAEKAVRDKETKLKTIQAKLDEVKKTVHYLSPDEAKETVLELNKSLNSLDVEIAGLQARILANGKYRFEKGNRLSDEALAKLEQMKGEDIISLAGALARKKAATAIHHHARELYELNKLQTRLRHETDELKAELSRDEKELRQTENQLEHPTPDKLVPKVFQNKVTIYPVRAGE